MNPIEPRVQAALDAAMNQIRTAASAAAMRVAEHLGALAQSAVKIAERDQLIFTQQELRRNLGAFQGALHQALRERVAKELAPRVDTKRKLESADWQTLSLVDEKEVEEQMNFVRLGQMISHECEWQLREMAAYMGALLSLGRADDDRNPLRAEVVGAALHRGIEAISGERESRRILSRELGQAVALAMPDCYSDILKMLQERGIRPVHLTVRTVKVRATSSAARIRATAVCRATAARRREAAMAISATGPMRERTWTSSRRIAVPSPPPSAAATRRLWTAPGAPRTGPWPASSAAGETTRAAGRASSVPRRATPRHALACPHERRSRRAADDPAAPAERGGQSLGRARRPEHPARAVVARRRRRLRTRGRVRRVGGSLAAWRRRPWAPSTSARRRVQASVKSRRVATRRPGTAAAA